ncbi:unnamed protein product [Darwinula stevensoni]|uniref:Uncharacterized protein n=1 Tax=Darwinula stevensoni TaxID=69355 RepID=A0A7R9AAR8_9CRUS|nr:unnamed protein product [Darwinula stevensoni]CAG0898685.1 unnamed protein product [Darwinula stevensoni]
MDPGQSVLKAGEWCDDVKKFVEAAGNVGACDVVGVAVEAPDVLGVAHQVFVVGQDHKFPLQHEDVLGCQCVKFALGSNRENPVPASKLFSEWRKATKTSLRVLAIRPKRFGCDFNAGRYHSFVEDRRDVPANPTDGKWMKSDDASVESVETNDAFLEAECFGGDRCEAETDARTMTSSGEKYRLTIFNSPIYDTTVTGGTERNRNLDEAFFLPTSFRPRDDVEEDGGWVRPERSTRSRFERMPSPIRWVIFEGSTAAGRRHLLGGSRNSFETARRRDRSWIRQQVAEENLGFFSFPAGPVSRGRGEFPSSSFAWRRRVSSPTRCSVSGARRDRSSDGDECIVTLSLAFSCDTYLRLESEVGLVVQKRVELLRLLLSLDAPSRPRRYGSTFLPPIVSSRFRKKWETASKRAVGARSRSVVASRRWVCILAGRFGTRGASRRGLRCRFVVGAEDLRDVLRGGCLSPSAAVSPGARDAENISSTEKGESGSTGMGGGGSMRHWSPSQTREISSLRCTLALLVLSCDVSALGRSRQGEREGSSRVRCAVRQGEEEGTGMPEIVSQVPVRNDSRTAAFLHETVSIARKVPSIAMLVGKLLVTLGRCQPRLSRLVLAEILVRLLHFVAGFWVSGAVRRLTPWRVSVAESVFEQSVRRVETSFRNPTRAFGKLRLLRGLLQNVIVLEVSLLRCREWKTECSRIACSGSSMGSTNPTLASRSTDFWVGIFFLQFLEGNGNGADSADRFLVLTAVIQSYRVNDSRRSYQALKLVVSPCGKLPLAREPSSTRRQWAVGWLRRKMADRERWTAEVDTSDEDASVSLAFRRTASARDALASADAPFTEFEFGEMEIEEEEGPRSKRKQRDAECRKGAGGPSFRPCPMCPNFLIFLVTPVAVMELMHGPSLPLGTDTHRPVVTVGGWLDLDEDRLAALRHAIVTVSSDHPSGVPNTARWALDTTPTRPRPEHVFAVTRRKALRHRLREPPSADTVRTHDEVKAELDVTDRVS